MLNFAIGDTVRVLSYDEICNKTEDYRSMRRFTKADEYFTSEMRPFCGSILTIKSITSNDKYRAEGNSHFWIDEMFESITPTLTYEFW